MRASAGNLLRQQGAQCCFVSHSALINVGARVFSLWVGGGGGVCSVFLGGWFLVWCGGVSGRVTECVSGQVLLYVGV